MATVETSSPRVTDEGRSFVPEKEGVEQKYEYPGIPVTCDGAEAVVHVETHIAQGTGAAVQVPAARGRDRVGAGPGRAAAPAAASILGAAPGGDRDDVGRDRLPVLRPGE